LKELAVRIHEDEKALEGLLQETPALKYVRSLPGMGPILAAVVVSEPSRWEASEIDCASAQAEGWVERERTNQIDGIERFPALWLRRPLSFRPAGARLFKANYYDIATNGCARAFVEAAWAAIGCSAYFGDFYKRKRALGKKPSLAILATARLMARITWQLLRLSPAAPR
jgi:hypothetical protein